MFLRKCIHVLYILLLALSGIELVKYSGVVAHYFFFDVWQWVIGFLVLVALWRIVSPRDSLKNWSLISWNNTKVLPTVVVLCMATFIAEIYTYTNFVFSTFHINHLVFVDLLLLSFFFKILTASRDTVRKHWSTFLFFSFLLICFFLYTYFFEYFHYLSSNLHPESDGNFMERLQVNILLIGVGITLLLSYFHKNIWLRLAYVGAALFLVVLAGEEVSWGEQLRSLPFIADAKNYQNEFNLHNQKGVNEITAFLYIFALFYAVGSWWVRSQVEKKHTISAKSKAWWDLFCFRLHEALYFVPTFIFNPYADRTLVRGYPPILDFFHSKGLTPEFYTALHFLAYWRETFEVLFYGAVVLHFWNILREQPPVSRFFTALGVHFRTIVTRVATLYK